MQLPFHHDVLFEEGEDARELVCSRSERRWAAGNPFPFEDELTHGEDTQHGEAEGRLLYCSIVISSGQHGFCILAHTFLRRTDVR